MADSDSALVLFAVLAAVLAYFLLFSGGKKKAAVRKVLTRNGSYTRCAGEWVGEGKAGRIFWVPHSSRARSAAGALRPPAAEMWPSMPCLPAAASAARSRPPYRLCRPPAVGPPPPTTPALSALSLSLSLSRPAGRT